MKVTQTHSFYPRFFEIPRHHLNLLSTKPIDSTARLKSVHEGNSHEKGGLKGLRDVWDGFCSSYTMTGYNAVVYGDLI